MSDEYEATVMMQEYLRKWKQNKNIWISKLECNMRGQYYS